MLHWALEGEQNSVDGENRSPIQAEAHGMMCDGSLLRQKNRKMGEYKECISLEVHLNRCWEIGMEEKEITRRDSVKF